jgi:integrase
VTGTRLTPPHALGSPEWWQALQEARARIAGEPAERPGTWGALVTSYRASPRFPKDLAPRTRKDYQAVLDYLAPLHDVVLTRWSRSFVAGLRDKAQTQKGRRFANYVLSVVSVVFAHGIEFELAATNPVRDVRKLRRPKGEALAAGRDSWNRTAGTRTRISAKSGKVVVVKAPEVVVAALHRLPAHAAATLLVNSRGEPWAENGFRGSFFRLIRTLEAAGRVADGLTFHGLRHTAATQMRRLGFDTRTIADMLGQETEGMAAHYSREADLEPKLRGVVTKLDEENRKREGSV